MHHDNSQQWLTTKQAADYVNRSTRTIFRWKDKGYINCKFLNRRFMLVSKQSLDDIINNWKGISNGYTITEIEITV